MQYSHKLNAIVRIASNQNGDAIGSIASNLISMQYSLLHRTLAVAIDVLHQHDLDAKSYCISQF